MMDWLDSTFQAQWPIQTGRLGGGQSNWGAPKISSLA